VSAAEIIARVASAIDPAFADAEGRLIRMRRGARSAAAPTRGGTVNDADEEQDDEVDEAPGVEEWIADESRAEEVADGLDGTASEE
jgi:hypothetical protein